jgi:NTP pyrophosphatase (non-canonical NTP hydrolase)
MPGSASRHKFDLDTLRAANLLRQSSWDPENRITPSYLGMALAGELGEALNIVKKLEREALGLPGSRGNVEDLALELADVIIYLDLLAARYGIDLGPAVIAKFNATSEKLGFPERLS